MKEEFIKKVLREFKKGDMTIDEAIEYLRDLPFLDLFHTKIDTLREIRRGVPEVIYGEGKSFEQILEIVRALREKGEDLLITRLEDSIGERLKEEVKEGEYNRLARVFFVKKEHVIKGKGLILVVCAGTSDISVAEEAYVTSFFLGNVTERIYDVGISGIHRLTAYKDLLKRARVIICVAGMEGALPSIISGLTSVPVIGVPTSVGYGSSFHGVSALLTMLNSCSTVAVFNIDNGFGAAYFATLINRL